MRFLKLSLLLCALPFFGYSQSYFLNGTAQAVGNDCYQLTAATGNQNGTVWYADQLDLDENFTLEFTMNFGNSDGGADGMVFVLQTVGTNAIGISGGGIGFSGFEPSVGVEFDTWQNTNNSDPSFDHIALVINGSVDHGSANNIAGPVQADIGSTNIEDGEDHVVKISWGPSTNNLRVYFDCELRIDTFYDITGVFPDSEVWFGFTGSTGGAWNTQTVCLSENIVSVGPNVTICNGASTQLSVGGDPNGTYVWTPGETLDDPNSAGPIASPTETTTYNVQYSDLCGATQNFNVTVDVVELEVTTDEAELLSCDNITTELLATDNFDNDVSYNWTSTDGTIVNGGTSDSPVVSGPGTYTVVADFDGQCFATDSVTVDGQFEFDVSLEADEFFLTCDVDEANIEANTPYNLGVVYDWSTTDGTIDNGQGTDDIDVTSAGTYNVEAFMNEYCFATASITINEDFEAFDIDAGPDMALDCITPTVELLGSTTSTGGQIFWSTNGGNIVSGLTTLTPDVNEAGTYTITIINSDNGCENTDMVSVSEDFTTPIIATGPGDTLSCEDPYAVLDGLSVDIDDYSVQWSTGDGNILSGFQSNTPSVDAAGLYTVTVTNNANGCTATGTVEVLVDDNFFLDVSSLTVPNVFSPGTDQRNDYFRPFLAKNPEFNLEPVMQEFSLNVYNRWGNLVYSSDETNKHWDGRSNGEYLPEGSYYYILKFTIECSVNASEEISGHVLILRDVD